MTLPTTAVQVRVAAPGSGAPVAGARVQATLNHADLQANQHVYLTPSRVVARTDAAGLATLDLWPNELGSTASSYEIQITTQTGGVTTFAGVVVPVSSIPVTLDAIATLPPYPGKADGAAAMAMAAASAMAAQDYAGQAQASEIAAETARAAAAASAVSAGNSAGAAASAATVAAAAQTTILAAAAVVEAQAATVAADTSIAAAAATTASAAATTTHADSLAAAAAAAAVVGVSPWPASAPKTLHYTSGVLTSITGTDGTGTAWTQTLAYTSGVLTSATIANGTDGWIKTLSYTSGVLTGSTIWVKQ